MCVCVCGGGGAVIFKLFIADRKSHFFAKEDENVSFFCIKIPSKWSNVMKRDP